MNTHKIKIMGTQGFPLTLICVANLHLFIMAIIAKYSKTRLFVTYEILFSTYSILFRLQSNHSIFEK